MGISTQAQQFAHFLESVHAKASTPGLDLAVVRDVVDTHASASTEPEGVTYAGRGRRRRPRPVGHP
ncbi:hypothetical protein [Streptomyces sp. NPDC086777]|uniref:hypothetical protein n=1 Tax=Streptomyces sp. NPDC086777 TaxID=3154866 RepID=UPI00344C5FE5